MYLKLFIFFVLFLNPLKHLHAAAPFVHVLLAQKYLETRKHRNQSKFDVGTLFPDIRYLKFVTRQETHFKSVTLSVVDVENSDFVAGMKFHSYVDTVRENFANKKGIYKFINKFEKVHAATLLKLAEDEVLWDLKLAQKIKVELDNFAYKDVDFKIEEAQVLVWNKYLSNYFSEKPSAMLLSSSKQNKGSLNIPADQIKKWNLVFNQVTTDENLRRYCFELAKLFEEKIKK